MRTLSLLLFLVLLAGCAQMRTLTKAYQALPADNVAEEFIEGIIEVSVEASTGQNVHIDISGDSPEK